MTKNENLSIIPVGESHAFTPKIKFGKQPSKPDLFVSCLLCDSQFAVKYIPPKKRYSQKNNWGYWTKKESNKHKYLCNSCLVKLYDGNINDWIKDETRADVFYNYIKRGQF